VITKSSHEADHAATLAYWRSLSPDQRVALAVELSRRMRQMQIDNGRAPEEISSISKRCRR
jgi:hypothetical protein